jgi:hypothetical protein
MEDNKPKISNLEWGLVIGALFVVDLIQIGVEWLMIWLFGASIIVNFIIDLAVGMGFAFYLQMRGLSMADPKRLFTLIGTFGLEMWPGLQELPLWSLDGVLNMLIYKSETIVKIIPVVNKVAVNANKVINFVQRPKRVIGGDKNNDYEKAA